MQRTESGPCAGTRCPLFLCREVIYLDVGAWTQIIGSLGFPIAACIALFWQNAKQSEKHAEELRQITEALNNNTVALTELSAKIGGIS